MSYIPFPCSVQQNHFFQVSTNYLLQASFFLMQNEYQEQRVRSEIVCDLITPISQIAASVYIQYMQNLQYH